ncbi:metallophosphoesterase [Olivibacter sp. SDN3]|uniref:metallophosphoesterase n=1 Tax=Olivibacter sp. SDN3 TaxID=2764720 RepID=UPI001650E338|nr:metallophosphoesterase [Olivibacter sp. SDN3]QNL51225.1 metallophosphoesterase [Olivibacter sp. SDN3]
MNVRKKTVLYLMLCFLLVACQQETEEITFVLLPDTQTYAEKYPEILDAQISWIEENTENIDLVLQQGDLTQNNNDIEWQRVQKSFQRLDNKVPYVLAVGNHDMGSGPGNFADERNTTLFNKYFPLDKMSALPAYGGTFEDQKLDNTYYVLETGRQKWLILSLEFGPREAVLEWANEIVAKHQDKLIILNTHSYMYSDSTRQGYGDNWRAQGYGVGQDEGQDAVNDGEQIWEKFVKKHPNVRFVFSGHILNNGVGTLVSVNDAGFPVYQFLANYQEGVKGSVKGGNGWLRILKLRPKEKRIKVETYSPYINEYMDDEAHSFHIKEVFLRSGY